MASPVTKMLRWLPDPLKRSLKRVPILRSATDRLYRGIGEEATQIPGAGFSLYLDFRSPTQRSYATTRSSEDYVVRHLQQSLRPGDVVADIGGYVGYFTMLSAACVTASGAVMTFEPVPENAARIRRSAEMNGFAHVTVEETALSDAPGQREIWIEREAGGSPSSTSSLVGDGSESITVRVATFDEYAAERGLQRLDLLKIDVEGLEAEVVGGMLETIRRLQPELVVEFKDDDAVGPCTAIFDGLGYETHELGRSRHGLHLSARPR